MTWLLCAVQLLLFQHWAHVVVGYPCFGGVSWSSLLFLMQLKASLINAVVDRRLRPPSFATWGVIIISTPFSCRYIRRDIMCKHDVISTRPLRYSRPRPRREKSRPVTVSLLACNGYSDVLFVAKAACELCFHQLGGHVELRWLMPKYDVIYKTGST